ncbi:MAG: hypothetical protein JWM44_2122 [Bacilli bacterium]|nr:hypothetical protein [Bacilli bacterium]
MLILLAFVALIVLSACVSQSSKSVKVMETTASAQIPELFAEDVVSLQLLSGFPSVEGLKAFQQDNSNDFQQITKVIGWLNSAKLTHGETIIAKHGYPKTMQINFKNGIIAEIEPAYKCSITTNADGSGTKTCPQVENEVLLSYGSKYSWLKSPELYTWLQGGWKQDNSN